MDSTPVFSLLLEAAATTGSGAFFNVAAEAALFVTE